MAMLGAAMQPQQGAVTQGVPPSTPEEHSALAQRWKGFFTNPTVQAGLFQFGASMLSNIGTNAPLGRRIGLSLGDTGRAVGGAAKFQADQQAEQARQQAEQERLAQGRTGLAQNAQQIQQQGEFQKGSLGMEEKKLQQSAEQAAADRELKLQELQSNDSYRKMALSLQKEQLQSTLLGMQTPRGRALLALQKSALDSMDLDSMDLDPNFDADTYIANGLKVIDQMFGSEGASATQAPSGVPSASGTPGANPTGGPVGGAPASGANLESPGGFVKGQKAKNPTTGEVIEWDGEKWIKSQ